MMNLSVSLIAFLLSWAVTASLLSLARRFGWVDRPNPRSSHAHATPTLGGLAIVGATIVACWLGEFDGTLTLTIASVVLLGLVIDDTNGPLGVTSKAGIQLAAAMVWVATSSLPPVDLPLVGSLSGWGLSLLSGLWLISWMNVFNFMDGIDGISGSQAVVAGVSLSVMLSIAAPAQAGLPLWLACASAGFLIFNLTPARIFMGDVGSAFLGLGFGVVTLQVMSAGISIFVAVLPLAVYLYDSGLTIMRRMIRGENVLRAHRQHLYQKLAQCGWSHGQISLAVALLTGLLGTSAYGFARGMIFWPAAQASAAFIVLVIGSAATWNLRDD